MAQALGPGHRVVTVLCDSGARHLSKFWRIVRHGSSSFTSTANTAGAAEAEAAEAEAAAAAADADADADGDFCR